MMHTEKMLSKEQHLSVLESARETLSDIDNWCSVGMWERTLEGKTRQCLYSTVSNTVAKLYGFDARPYETCDLVTKAAREVMGDPKGEPVHMNDGQGKFHGMPREDRHKLVLATLDKAISYVKESKPNVE